MKRITACWLILTALLFLSALGCRTNHYYNDDPPPPYRRGGCC